MAFARTLRHQPLGVIGILLLVLFVTVAVLAPPLPLTIPRPSTSTIASLRRRIATGSARTSWAAISSRVFFRVHDFR